MLWNSNNSQTKFNETVGFSQFQQKKCLLRVFVIISLALYALLRYSVILVKILSLTQNSFLLKMLCKISVILIKFLSGVLSKAYRPVSFYIQLKRYSFRPTRFFTVSFFGCLIQFFTFQNLPKIVNGSHHFPTFPPFSHYFYSLPKPKVKNWLGRRE